MELLGQARLRTRMATRRQRTDASSRRRMVSLTTSLLVGTALTPLTVLAPAAVLAPADAAVGQGFNLNAVRPAVHPQADQDRRAARGQRRRRRTRARTCSGTAPTRSRPTAQGDELPWGLRTVDGTCNNLVAGQAKFGAADQTFPRRGTRTSAAPSRAAGVPGRDRAGDHLRQTAGNVVDSQPRVISNLIVDQTADNPAAVAAAGDGRRPPDASGTLFIPNVGAGRRAVRAVQLVVHAVRPVLRPRPGPGQQGRQRHRLRAADSRRPAVQPGARRDQLHGAAPAPPTSPATQRGRSTRPTTVRRPEPDLHLAPVAPGLPARVRR